MEVVMFIIETSLDSGKNWEFASSASTEEEAIQKKREIDHFTLGLEIDVRIVPETTDDFDRASEALTYCFCGRVGCPDCNK